MPNDSIALGELTMGLLGGMALFLFGMGQMCDALKRAAGDGMRTLLGRLTTNRLRGAVTGAVVTAVIQSSTVTTMLVVGFVSAGLISLQQSIGVIMGANVGTTITAQVVAFKITKYALLLVAVGFGLQFTSKRSKVRLYGTVILGLGLIFFGMGQMSEAARPLRTYQPFIDVMQSMNRPALGILASAVFTVLVQSSSATTGIVIVLASQGFISLEAGIAIAFGANIGTCLTAVLGALGKPVDAMRAGVVHVLFNVIGVLLWLGLIDYLADFVRFVSPSHPELLGTDRLAAETPRQIANAHTAFNVANTLLFLPISGLFARMAVRIVPDRPLQVPDRARPRYLDDIYLETPALALDRARLELGRMGELVAELADRTIRSVRNGTEDELLDVVERHREIDKLYEAILDYLGRLSQGEIDPELSRELSSLFSVASNVEHVNEILATNVVALGRERLELGLPPEEETAAVLEPLTEKVRWALQTALESLRVPDPDLARHVLEVKPEVQALARQATEQLGRQLVPGDAAKVTAVRLQTRVVELQQRIYYFAKKIAKEVVHDTEQTWLEEPELTDPSGTF